MTWHHAPVATGRGYRVFGCLGRSIFSGLIAGHKVGAPESKDSQKTRPPSSIGSKPPQSVSHSHAGRRLAIFLLRPWPRQRSLRALRHMNYRPYSSVSCQSRPTSLNNLVSVQMHRDMNSWLCTTGQEFCPHGCAEPQNKVSRPARTLIVTCAVPAQVISQQQTVWVWNCIFIEG